MKRPLAFTCTTLLAVTSSNGSFWLSLSVSYAMAAPWRPVQPQRRTITAYSTLVPSAYTHFTPKDLIDEPKLAIRCSASHAHSPLFTEGRRRVGKRVLEFRRIVRPAPKAPCFFKP